MPLALFQITAALGALSIGTMFGFMCSITAWSYPSINSVQSLTAKQRLAFWSDTFRRGVGTAIPLLLVATVALGVAAAVVPEGDKRTEKRVLLSVAAALSFANLAFTKVAMMPTVDTLWAIDKALAKDSGAEYDADEIDRLVAKWVNLHAYRILFTGSAFTLVVTSLVLR